ncbi:hypothetical protein RB595_005176 [Gaeumannomyces hyphopodioides]
MAATHQQMLASKSDLDALQTSVDSRFDAVDSRFEAVDRRFEAVDRRFDAVDRRFDAFQADVDRRFDLLTLEIRRIDVRFRNSRLKNPFNRIEPAPGFDLKAGIVYPDPKLFPRNARAFYALRNPSTAHQRQVLDYLRAFYELQRDPEHGGSSNDDDDDDDDDDDEAGPSADTPEHTVDELQAILGLEEDKFIRFKERAEEFSANALAATGKHPHAAPDAGRDRPLQQVRTAVAERDRPRQLVWTGALESDSFDRQTGLRWGSSSTPSSQRRTINNLPKPRVTLPIHPHESSDSASPTNAVSTPSGLAGAG